MTMQHSSVASAASYQIRFASLRTSTPALTFRCDARGNVELDALDEKARLDYLFARALVGRNFARPAIVRAHADMLS